MAESDRLIRLVSNLLILAGADVVQSLRRESVSIRAVIEEACKQAQQLDRQRKIIEDVREVSVIGDRGALKRVLPILLDSAIKYTTQEIQISTKASENQIEISVHDKGPGIPAERLEHVFDRFYRGESDSKIQGFGLGLPIAKALLEGQGGKIGIESGPGAGTTVKISLNLRQIRD
ncbi:MAG TPA: ATP-binding protein [Anaerolineales bacterium]|nr:ATP-binding protein [Anaerolineales bacterium]